MRPEARARAGRQSTTRWRSLPPSWQHPHRGRAYISRAIMDAHRHRRSSAQALMAPRRASAFAFVGVSAMRARSVI